MGILRFRIPNGLSDAAARELSRACMAGGYDGMPAPTRATVDGDILRLQRDSDESGYAAVPWEIPGIGRLMTSTATLVDQAEPLFLPLELARGKVNQARCQLSDWQSMGMAIPEPLAAQSKAAVRQFAQAVTASSGQEMEKFAQAALVAASGAGEILVNEYVDQLFRARHSRQKQLDTLLGVRINGSVPPTASNAVAAAVNCAVLPLTWRAVEPTEANYRWEPTDTALAWAERLNLRVTAGPLIDFVHRALPDWLWLWDGDLQSLVSFMCDYVETAVGRYRGRIRRWQLCTAGNVGGVLKLGEDDLLWLTARLAEAAWQVDPDLELTIGIAQPWGDYMGREERTYSPFVFADTLIRAGLKLTALDVELFMGISPRASFCRDTLDTSKLLDLYGLLGIPIQVSLAYPGSADDDALADPTLSPEGGFWCQGHSPETQANWAARLAALAMSKPYVRGVTWAHLTDGEEHSLPNCGLLDPAGRPRLALSRLQQVRQEHLR